MFRAPPIKVQFLFTVGTSKTDKMNRMRKSAISIIKRANSSLPYYLDLSECTKSGAGYVDLPSCL